MSNILLGVTGGISAYKAADIIGALKKHDHIVKVIMTNRAKDFITPLTLATLSKNPVYDDQTEWAPHGRIDHIELPKWADVFVIAPATANTLAKMAQGIADNLLTSAYLAYDKTKPVIYCPAMNSKMYEDSKTVLNICTLERCLNHFKVGPETGILACGDYGIGKIAPTKAIIENINALVQRK
jgi:phosphopantothenoylcysteine synthetase/decarboxylase